jgi:hypothetical protein
MLPRKIPSTALPTVANKIAMTRHAASRDVFTTAHSSVIGEKMFAMTEAPFGFWNLRSSVGSISTTEFAGSESAGVRCVAHRLRGEEPLVDLIHPDYPFSR